MHVTLIIIANTMHIIATCYFIVASNPVFHEFKQKFSGQIINPTDLVIKEQIGEGEYFTLDG